MLTANNLSALVAPTGAPAWPTDLVNGDHFLGASSGPAAIAGYPIVQVPAGDAFGLPVGISFIGTAWSEADADRLASGSRTRRGRGGSRSSSRRCRRMGRGGEHAAA